VSDADSASRSAETGGAGAIVERAADPAIARLRAAHPAAADSLARALRDGTLSVPLTAKPLSKLAGELLESLSSPPSRHAD
jgi:hypothetical protein